MCRRTGTMRELSKSSVFTTTGCCGANCGGPKAPAESLSGGNLQKFILGRELSKHPQLLVCSNPTRGIDVRASWSIRNQILEAKKSGMAVVLSSGDFEELLYLSDRIVVLYKGMIFAQTTPEETTVTQLGSMMMGRKPV